MGITDRVRKMFAGNPDVIVYGHSHNPEIVTIGDKFMVVDEEGRIKNLKRNHKASIMTGQIIVGDVFTIKKDDFE